MKKRYLKKGIENTLLTIIALIISFIAMTIDSLGNPIYDKILIVSMLVLVGNSVILSKWGRCFNEE